MEASISAKDKAIVRDLAVRYAELCNSERNRSALKRWRDLNNMRARRPLVFCNVHLLMTVRGDVSRISRWAQIPGEEAERVAV